MPQITGQQTGTAQSDLFIGSLEIVDLTESTSESGILDATLQSLSGDDTIESIVTLRPDAERLTLEAIGIENTTVKAGAGNDTVFAQGSTSKFITGINPRIGFITSGSGFAYGLAASDISGGSGDDALTFIGTGNIPDNFFADRADSAGIFQSTVSGNAGRDTITIKGETGAIESTVNGGSQQDTITITGEGRTATEQGQINGGADDDIISIDSADRGIVSTVRGTLVRGGSGNDTINIEGTAQSVSARGLPGSSGTVVGENALVSGGSGNDSLTISSTISAAGGASGSSVRNSQVTSGAGNDNITIRLQAGGLGVSDAAAVLEATVNGGSGNDVMEFIAVGSGSGVGITAARQSEIRGGAGDDEILFKVSGVTGSAVTSSGIVDTEVFGGAGNDAFKVEVEPFEAAAADRQAAYDITDALIFGNSGDDTFDVGIGNGTLNGGAGNDLAIIDFFDADAVNVVAIANGVQLIGSQTKSGTAGSWTQNITNIENFQIGDVLYTAESLVTTFSG